jgi:hypothetical protein
MEPTHMGPIDRASLCLQTHLSRFHLKMETEPSLRNVFLKKTGQRIKSKIVMVTPNKCLWTSIIESAILLECHENGNYFMNIKYYKLIINVALQVTILALHSQLLGKVYR